VRHQVQGFAPGLAAQVEAALAAAGVPVPVQVTAHPLYDLKAQSHTADVADAAGRRVVLVLWTQGQCWISTRAAAQPCFHCLQLRRLHGWTVGFTRNGAGTRDDVLSASPLVDMWLSATIAAAASEADTEADTVIDKARLVSLDHRTVSVHRYTRHPDCPRCRPLPDNSAAVAAQMFHAEGDTPRGLRGVSLRTMAAAVLPDAKDGRIGLIRRIAPRSGTPLLGMRAAALYPFKDPATIEEGFGRSGNSANDAVVALLEGLERFAGMRPRGQRTVVQGSYAALQAQALDPRSYILHAPEQYGQPGFTLAEYSPDTVYDWVWGYSLRRGGAVLVPLQLAYYGLGRSAHVTGGRFVYEISNGCALGSSLAEAALHGLLEVIERDAFLACWYSQRAVDTVDLRGCADPFVRAMLARLSAEGLETQCYDIRCGLPPAAFAIRLTDPELRFGPAALYAAGAHLDRDDALRAALAEAVTFVYRYDEKEKTEKMNKALALLDSPAQVRFMADHALQCWPQRALAERSFMTSSGPALSWSALPSVTRSEGVPTAQLLAGLVEATLAVAADVIVIDQGFEPYRARGVHCAKVLVPGLLPMTFGHQHRRISAARLEQVAGGAETRSFRSDPHIFP
jgi:ribosomal protein S12 methylthiotransferase accessory factor